jgi:hypothetical protein
MSELHDVTVTPEPAVVPVTDRPLIRPPDPAVTGRTLRLAPYGSAEATRRFIHLAFRDALAALDLTFAHGAFWRDPLLPLLDLTTSNCDPLSSAELRRDFTATGLAVGAWDLTVIDPPHIADGGAASIMGTRYGTVRGTAALRDLTEAGSREAWRVARQGVIVKVQDCVHASRCWWLSRWVQDVMPCEPYDFLHLTRARKLNDPKWKRQLSVRRRHAT